MAYLLHALSKHLDWFPLTIASDGDFDRAYIVFAIGFFIFARGLGRAVLGALSSARAAREAAASPYRSAAAPVLSPFGVSEADAPWAAAFLGGAAPAVAERLIARAFAEQAVVQQAGGSLATRPGSDDPRIQAWLAKVGTPISLAALRASAIEHARSMAPAMTEGLLRAGYLSTARARGGAVGVTMASKILLASIGLFRMLRFASVAPVTHHTRSPARRWSPTSSRRPG